MRIEPGREQRRDPWPLACAVSVATLLFSLPQCSTHVGQEQRPPEQACGDGIDNDSDGLIDCADPDCASFAGCQETPSEICDNEQDDDGDGLVDCADPDCASVAPCAAAPTEICTNGIDDDGDNLIDCLDPDCAEHEACRFAPTEDCDNGVDDDGDHAVDCDDSACQNDSFCNPTQWNTDSGRDFHDPQYASVSIIVATDYREGGARQLYVNIDGLPASMEADHYLALTHQEGWQLFFGLTAGMHRISLNLDGAAIWDFGALDFQAGQHTTLVAYGDLGHPLAQVFPEPTGLGPDEVVVRMLNVWDTREPLDVLLCPQGAEVADCTLRHEDLAYGELWEETLDRNAAQSLLWERTPPPGYPHDRYTGGASNYAGEPFCYYQGPWVGTTVLTNMLLLLPYQVSLDPSCLGCSSDFVVNEPFPVDIEGFSGACP